MEKHLKILITALIAVLSLMRQPCPAGEIHEAAGAGDIKKVQQFLKENPELLNVGDMVQGQLPLHRAAQGGSKEMTAFLISRGASVHAKDRDGQTALHVAASPAVGDLLIGRGADVTARDSYGRTPLHYAAYYGRDKMVGYFLEKGGEINGLDEEKNTPLMWALMNGHPETALLLMAQGAALNLRNAAGASALSIAKKKGYRTVVDELTKKNVTE
ncbi:MAG: ankyrin repeat domain-containing protein [Candidatus Eremiobacteraeota bacterium]|nr:ankyrin repeat domain-containing protein [Candidatus Eremiobacteraeota bacterium]